MLTQQSVIQDASSCDADDEEPENDYDTVLDLSCKRTDVKDEEGSGGGKKEAKRKHLRKKRRDERNGGGVPATGVLGSVLVARPSVISFVPADQETSSSDEDEAARVFRRRRNKRAVYLREESFDVDEHFRRSLGGVWDTIGGGSAAPGIPGITTPSVVTPSSVVQSNEVSSVGGSRVVIEDSIKPSDVDDHFAKALGSETWSKIVQSRASSTTRASRSRSRSPVRVSPPDTQSKSPPTVGGIPPPAPPPPPPSSSSVISSAAPVQSSRPNQTISNSSNIFKIDAILGNNRGE